MSSGLRIVEREYNYPPGSAPPRIIFPVGRAWTIPGFEKQLENLLGSEIKREKRVYKVEKVTVVTHTDKIEDFHSVAISQPQLTDEQRQTLLTMGPLSMFLQVEAIRIVDIRRPGELPLLRFVDDRVITWKEVSAIIRRFRWDPYIARQYGVAVLVADVWGKERRIVSAAQLRTMTPAQFWQRLKHLDPYRVSQVERGIF